MEFDNYQHDLDSQEYVYESDFVINDEEVDGTADDDHISDVSDKECWKCWPTGVAYKHMKDSSIDNDDDECMTEVKDPDLDDQKDISLHHNGILLQNEI